MTSGRHGVLRRRALLAGAAALGTGMPGRHRAAAADPLDALAVDAAKSGKVTWYESSTAEQLAQVAAAFHARFPAVRVQPVRLAGGNALSARVIQESPSGRATADCVSGGAGHLAAVAERGLVREVDWTALGTAPGLAAGRLAMATSASLYTLLSNTRLLGEDGGPADWDGLLHPALRGRVGTWATPVGFAQLAAVWGLDRVAALVERFMANAPVLASSTFQLATMVASGELAAGFGIQHAAAPAIARGAPLRVRLPDPLPVSTIYTFVPTRTANPAGGTLLAAWLASPDGEAAYAAATGRGNPRLPGSAAEKAVGPARLSEFPVADTARYQEALARLQGIMAR